MNQVLSLVRTARAFPACRHDLTSERMRTELLALHEEMVSQLRQERSSAVQGADFIGRLISQHEEAAATLRTVLGKKTAG